MVTKKQMREIVGCGRMRQILERGYLSSGEIQFVIDAVYEKTERKSTKNK